MTESDGGIPQLLGPGGEPLGPAPAPVDAPAAPAGASQTPPAGSSGESPASAPATSEPGQAAEPQGPAFGMSTILAVDPRVIPATLVAVMNHDPIEAYRRRVEAARPQFDQTRDVMISAAEAQLMRHSQKPPEGGHRAIAARIVEQGFMRTMWDMCFETVSGAQVSLIFAAGMAGPERVASTLLSSNQDVPTVWVTTRALTIGGRFGAWAAPVTRDQQMPATVALTGDNFQQLRLSFAKVRV